MDPLAGWTLETFAVHAAGLRESDLRFLDERDRRYSEVKAAEEKALRIKEQSDRDALELARQIQTYKDEKANELREQINSERGLYATKADLAALADKFEAQYKPVLEFMSMQTGRGQGVSSTGTLIAASIGIVATLITIWSFTTRTQPQVIYTPAPAGSMLPTAPPAAVPR